MKHLGTVLALCVLAACAGGNTARQIGAGAATAQNAGALYDDAKVPAGAVGDQIKYGRDLLLHTRAHMRAYFAANMDCAACHIGGGTKARGGSFAGTAAAFPQWNARSKRVIALQDRVAECFLYSMDGRPPAYNSPEMIALASYITYLSRGVKLGTKPNPAVTLASISLPHSDPKAGARIYAQTCAACHGANGSGSAVFPPLWGSESFNNGAGMHRLRTMAGFVRYNMPQNAPGSLTDRQAVDVAAFVLSHPRPIFDRSRAVTFPPQAARYF